MFSYILYCELRFTDPAQPVDDESLAPASIGRGGLQMVLNLLELRFTSDELSDRYALQAKRDFVSLSV